MRDFEPLIDGLATNVAPVRSHSARAGRAALAAVSAATLAQVYLLYGFRPDVMAAAPPPMLLMAIGLVAILAVAAGASAVRMALPQVGAPSSGAPWALATLLLLPAIAIVGIIEKPGQAAGLDLAAGIRCLTLGLVAGLGSLTFLIIWLRRGAPVAPERAAWLAGLAAGSIGALAVTLECPEEAFAHLGIWHVAVPLVAAVATRLAIPRFLRW